MGVLNLTPDSFSDGGQYLDQAAAVAQVKLMIEQGATIIDVGGESTRPGAARVPLAEEQARVLPVIQAITAADWFRAAGARISVDTMNAETARAAIEAGAHIVNDVSGGLADPAMLATAAQLGVPYILSHWRGFSDQMDSLNAYTDVATDVAAELVVRVVAAEAAGIKPSQLILDPGLGFAKDAKQNWRLVGNLEPLLALGYPLLLGASRKRFIAAGLNPAEPASVSNERRDLASAVFAALTVSQLIWGYRVHNVQATIDALAVAEALQVARAD